MNKLNVATVFSGIGAPEQALLSLGYNINIVFACDNGEREPNIDIERTKRAIAKMSPHEANIYIKKIYAKLNKINYVKKSYMTNYKLKEDSWFEDIRFLDGKPYKGKIDLFVGGSPCQSFSIIGKRRGLEDTRGTLFYEFARLIKEIRPKVFIYENVPGMITHDKGNTWSTIKSVFKTLDYNIHYATLNSKDYGIPQDRNRLFVVGFARKRNFKFPKPMTLNCTMFDFLEQNVDPKHYLGKKGFEFVTNRKYRNRARINSKIIQTEKANQQFNWNGDFVFENLSNVKSKKSVMKRAYVGKWNEQVGVIRQLSYRECLRLMGFPDSFKIVVPNVHAYRQSGNSIVVNVLKEIIKEIYK